MRLTNWLNTLKQTFRRTRHWARRRRSARRATRSESLECRTLLTSTVYLDFGLGFAPGGMNTTVSELRDAVKIPILGTEISVPNSGPDFEGAAGLTASSPLNFSPHEYDFNGDNGYTSADTVALRDAVKPLVERAFAPFDIDVQFANAVTLADVSATIHANDGAADGERDAYVFVTAVDTPVDSLGFLTTTFGLQGGLDRASGTNTRDEVAVTLADYIFIWTSGTSGTSRFNENFVHRLAATAAHEAAHTFGLSHTSPTIGSGASAVDQPLTRGDQLREYDETQETTNMFTRFDLPLADSAGPQNNYNELRDDPDLGLVDHNNDSVPDFAYVTGTGAHDRITLSNGGSGVINVTVEAFRNRLMTPSNLIASTSYSINLATETQSGIRIDAGIGSDRVKVDPDVAVDVTVYGGDGADTLIGGAGNDWIYGERGSDSLPRSGGVDHRLNSNPDGTTISVGGDEEGVPDGGVNLIEGGNGQDRLFPGSDSDQLQRVESTDIVNGDLSIDGLAASVRAGWQSLTQFLDDAFQENLAAVQLPIIGNSIHAAAGFIEDLREQVSRNLEGVQSSAVETVRTALFDALGPSGLGFLADRPDDTDTIVTRDDIIQNIQFTSGIATDVNFDFRLGGEYAVETPVEFDVGLDALGLEVDGGVALRAGFDLLVGLGVSTTDGVYFNANTIDPVSQAARPELTLSLDASIPNLSATGRLGFLRVDVTDGTRFRDSNGNGQIDTGDALVPSRLFGEISVDLQEPDGDGRLTLTELATTPFEDLVDARLTGAADVHLGIRTRVSDGTALPSLATDFDLHWGFDSADLTGASAQFGDQPTIAFNNIRLDVGEFISRLASPILVRTQQVLGPIRTVTDALQRPIPVISQLAGDISLVDIARSLPGGIARVADFLDAVNEIDRLVSIVDAIGRTGSVRLGSFTLSGNDVRASSSAASLTPHPVEIGNVRAQLSSNAAAGEFLDATADVGNRPLSFPLLTDPTQAFRLLLGQDVNLFLYDMPELEVGFSYSQSFPIIGPLHARFTGEVGASADFAFGFDTVGLRRFAQSGNAADILNGFFVDAGSGAEVMAHGSITAGAELNAVVARAGVEGGIFANVAFDLNDPNQDGKVRLQELLGNLQHGPECLFDITGEIQAGLRAYVKVLIFKKRFNIATVTIPFGHHCDHGTPRLAEFNPDSGVLTLNSGPRAAAREFGNTDDGDEYFRVRAGDNGIVIVESLGFSEEYSGVQRIEAEGGAGDDVIEIDPEVPTAVELWGDFRNGTGEGNDVLHAGGGSATLHGCGGEDELHGGAANDWIHGGAGSDWLEGGEGNDRLDGGTDDDELGGGEGEDTLAGGSGDDFLEGGNGADVVSGNAGQDELSGDAGHDRLDGNEGDDLVAGGEGNDFVNGGDGRDSLYGDADSDTLIGGLGSDELAGGDAGDSLEGGESHDTLNGESGNDSILGGSGNDRLSGGGEHDLLLGGEHDDVVYGDEGDDTLNGGAGQDLLYGLSGDDRFQVTFEAATTTLVDQLFGGPNLDVIEVLGTDGADDLRIQQIAAGSFLIETYLPGTEQRLGTFAFSLPENPLDRDIELVRISGLAGDDRLLAHGEFNVNTMEIDGGPGNDLIEGSLGKDRIYGGMGNDTLRGRSGEDELHGGGGHDSLDGGDDTDAIYGDDFNDTIVSGHDTLIGGASRDVLRGGPGNDRLESGTDVWGDALRGEQGADTLIGGPGHDDLEGGDGADLLLGGDLGDNIDGGSGNDTLVGEFGRDDLEGGDDDDEVRAWISNEVRAELGLALLEELTLAQRQQWEIELRERLEFITPRKQALENLSPRTAEQQAELDALSDEVQLIGLTLADLQVYGSLYVDHVSGGNGNDDLYGSPLKDVIDGGDGDDRIFHVIGTNFDSSSPNGDTIIGGPGRDRYFVYGTESADIIAIQLEPQGLTNPEVYVSVNGQKTRVSGLEIEVAGVLGLGGNDVITANFGNNAAMMVDVDGGAGNDVINAGGDSAQNIAVFQHNATLKGGEGNDTLIGGKGFDVLHGEAGDDVLNGGEGNDQLVGGAGNDRYDFANAVVAQADTVSELHGEGVDTLNFAAVTANVSANLIADSFNPLTGATPPIASHNGRVVRTAANNQGQYFENLFGGRGNDTLTGNFVDNVIGGNEGNDIISGLTGNDTLRGGAGNDSLTGSHSDNVLDGGEGNDTMSGGLGRDVYVFGDALVTQIDLVAEGAPWSPNEGLADTLDFSGVTTAVTVNLGSDTALATHLRRTVRTFSTGQAQYIEHAIGGSAADRLTGNNANNLLTGRTGNDTLLGVNGNDSLVGESGNDSLDGGSGNDSLQGNSENDTVIGNAGNDLLDGGDGSDSLVGGAGNDTYNFADPQNTQTDTVSELTGGGTDSLRFDSVTTPITGNLASDTALATHSSGAATRTVRSAAAGQATNLEVLIGGTVGDSLAGNGIANVLVGNGGSDSLLGNLGNDSLEGGAGHDSLDGGVGDDTLAGNDGDDSLTGRDGNDALDGGAGNDALLGGIGNDKLNGGVGDNTAEGGDGNDELIVGLGTHRVFGGAGTNQLTVMGDDFANTILVSSGPSGPRVSGFGSTDASGISRVVIHGRGGNDHLSVGSLVTIPVVIYGGLGNDTLVGGSGNDSLFGGYDPTAFFYSEFDGNDEISGGAGHDFLHGGNGRDLLGGGAGNDTLDGNGGGNDTLIGGSGADAFLDYETIAEVLLDFSSAQGDTRRIVIT